MAGHIDYWNVGPAVFYSIATLVEGDVIEVVGEDDRIYSYKVNWVREYLTSELDMETIQSIVGPTAQRSLTLITCGGQFDYASGEYLSRTAVRAHFSGSRSA
jgi:sortase (surface protein transpeptidase)